jgi:predicted Zn-dependent protease
VVLHSALFRYSDNESQLASVMAHEISHVTQRHLARAMEDQKRNAPLTWVGALGSILLAMASPQAGMAALTGTLAGTRQGMISFTQQNEQEADRIGFRCCSARALTRRPCRPSWKNCSIRRVILRVRRKFC